MVSETTRDRFRRFASPACVAFGVLCGFIYAAMVYTPGGNYEARLVISALFVSAGAMGLAYFETRAMGTREVPFLVEQLRFFFGLWLFLGIVYGSITIFNLYIPDNLSPGEAVLSFIVGTVVGTVWMMALILMLGIRTNVATWNVIRFPAWIGAFVRWAWRKATRR
jgi:hypothetical protein